MCYWYRGKVGTFLYNRCINDILYVSFERLAADKRKQHGSTKYIIITVVAVTTLTTLSEVARLMRHDRLVRISV